MRVEGFGLRVPQPIARPGRDPRTKRFDLVEGACDVNRFRGGLVFKAHRLVYHSTLGWRVIKKKKTWWRVHEVGSYLRLIDSCITQLKAQEPSRTCNESKEEEKKHGIEGAGD